MDRKPDISREEFWEASQLALAKFGAIARQDHDLDAEWAIDIQSEVLIECADAIYERVKVGMDLPAAMCWLQKRFQWRVQDHFRSLARRRCLSLENLESVAACEPENVVLHLDVIQSIRKVLPKSDPRLGSVLEGLAAGLTLRQSASDANMPYGTAKRLMFDFRANVLKRQFAAT